MAIMEPELPSHQVVFWYRNLTSTVNTVCIQMKCYLYARSGNVTLQ